MAIKHLLKNTELFSKHLNLLYTTTNTPNDWSLFVNTLVSDLNCQSSLFSIEKTDTDTIPIAHFVGFDQQDIDYYFHYIIDNDIWLNAKMLVQG